MQGNKKALIVGIVVALVVFGTFGYQMYQREVEEIPTLELSAVIALSQSLEYKLYGTVVSNDGETVTIETRMFIDERKKKVFIAVPTQGMEVNKKYFFPEGERPVPREGEAINAIRFDEDGKTHYWRDEKISPAEIKVGDKVLFSFPEGHDPTAYVMAYPEGMPRGK